MPECEQQPQGSEPLGPHEAMLAELQRIGEMDAKVWTPRDWFTYEVGKRNIELFQHFWQLHLARYFLDGDYRPSGMSRSQYIDYHMLTYHVTLDGLLDRAYRLVSYTLRLDIPDRALWVVPELGPVQRSTFKEPLRKLGEIIRPYRKARHKMVHKTSYRSMDAALTMLALREERPGTKLHCESTGDIVKDVLLALAQGPNPLDQGFRVIRDKIASSCHRTNLQIQEWVLALMAAVPIEWARACKTFDQDNN